MRKIVLIIFILSLLVIPTAVTNIKICQAGCCGCDPVYAYDAKGEVKSAVWVRDQACVATGAIIDTLKAGEVVKITDKTDGWYKVVSPRGQVGWVGETFFRMTDKALTGSTPAPTPSPSPSPAPTTSNPVTNPTYSSSTLAWLKGYILLQVQEHGEAWYIYPKTKKRYYLKDGAAAYEIMRYLGLGITNTDLSKLASENLALIPYTASTGNTTTNTTGSSTIDQTFSGAGYISSGSQIAGTGSFQKGIVPSGFNYKIVTQHILDRINYERTKRGKLAIVSDQRMIDTASVWAEQMYLQGAITHTRLPVNMIAREWVWQNFKIGFREDWGWLYENIGGGSYNRSSGINERIMSSMDDLFYFYMSEEAANGIHYQTFMHDHLTHVGIGFYFNGSNDSGSLYTVLHYGGLNGNIGVIDKTWW